MVTETDVMRLSTSELINWKGATLAVLDDEYRRQTDFSKIKHSKDSPKRRKAASRYFSAYMGSGDPDAPSEQYLKRTLQTIQNELDRRVRGVHPFVRSDANLNKLFNSGYVITDIIGRPSGRFPSTEEEDREHEEFEKRLQRKIFKHRCK